MKESVAAYRLGFDEQFRPVVWDGTYPEVPCLECGKPMDRFMPHRDPHVHEARWACGTCAPWTWARLELSDLRRRLLELDRDVQKGWTGGSP